MCRRAFSGLRAAKCRGSDGCDELYRRDGSDDSYQHGTLTSNRSTPQGQGQRVTRRVCVRMTYAWIPSFVSATHQTIDRLELMKDWLINYLGG